MSLIEPGDLSQQLRSARSWLKESPPPALEMPQGVNLEIEQPAGINVKAEPPTGPDLSDAGPPPSQSQAQAKAQSEAAPKTQAKNRKAEKAPIALGSSGKVAAGQYDRMIEDMIRNESQAEIVQHVIKVERSEVAALVKQVARAKGRYLATLLESTKGKSVSSTSVEDLKQLRETHEELSQGLNDLRRHILDGTVLVEGVRN